jgi:hypothetical protein
VSFAAVPVDGCWPTMTPAMPMLPAAVGALHFWPASDVSWMTIAPSFRPAVAHFMGRLLNCFAAADNP